MDLTQCSIFQSTNPATLFFPFLGLNKIIYENITKGLISKIKHTDILYTQEVLSIFDSEYTVSQRSPTHFYLALA